MSTQKPNITLQIIFVAIVTIGALAYIINLNTNKVEASPLNQQTNPTVDAGSPAPQDKPNKAVPATNPGQEGHPTTGGKLPEIKLPPKKGIFAPKATVKIEKLQPTNTQAKAPTETPTPPPGNLENSTPGTPGDMQTQEPTKPEPLKGGFISNTGELDEVDPEIKASECQKSGTSMTACNDGNKSKKY